MDLRTQIYAEQVTGVNFLTLEQGTDEWFEVRQGVVTGSRCSPVFSSSEKGLDTLSTKLVSEIICDKPNFEGYMSKEMEWGKLNEEAALSAYSLQHLKSGKEITKRGFIFRDERLREGCSPDGIIVEDRTVLEVKCPSSKVFTEILLYNRLPPSWEKQAMFNIWVMDYLTAYVIVYDPRVLLKKMVVFAFYRDLNQFAVIESNLEKIHALVDEKLERLGYKYLDQWEDSMEILTREVK